jgi:Intron-binding protein aquarius N-terminus
MLFSANSLDDLRKVADKVGVLGNRYAPTANSANVDDGGLVSQAILTEVLVEFHEKRTSQLQRVNEMAIYPTEDIIWDDALVPDEQMSGKDQLQNY